MIKRNCNSVIDLVSILFVDSHRIKNFYLPAFLGLTRVFPQLAFSKLTREFNNFKVEEKYAFI